MVTTVTAAAHYTRKMVQVLLDTESDGDLVLLQKYKSMLLPYSKTLAPKLWNILNRIFYTERYSMGLS